MGTCAGNMCWEESLEDSLYTWTLANKSNTTSDSFGKPHLKGKKMVLEKCTYSARLSASLGLSIFTHRCKSLCFRCMCMLVILAGWL